MLQRKLPDPLTLVTEMLREAEFESTDLLRLPESSAVLSAFKEARDAAILESPEQQNIRTEFVCFVIKASRLIPAPFPKDVGDPKYDNGAMRAAGFQRKVFKCLSRMCGLINGREYLKDYYKKDEEGNYVREKGEKSKNSEPVALAELQMSEDESKSMPAAVQRELVEAFNDQSTSPLMVYLLAAFPPSFVRANDSLYNRMLSMLRVHFSTANETFMLLQPPYYAFSEERDGYISSEVVDAVIYLLESGDMQLAPTLKTLPKIMTTVLSRVNDLWMEAISTIESEVDNSPGCIGFSKFPDHPNEITNRFMRMMQTYKPVLRFATSCNVNPYSSELKAIVAAGRLNALKSSLPEIPKFFKSIDACGFNIDADTFIEGPLPLIPDLIEKFDTQFKPLAMKLSIEEVLRGMAHFPENVKFNVSQLILRKFGYSPDIEGWDWVSEIHKIYPSTAFTEQKNSSKILNVKFYTHSAPVTFVHDDHTLKIFEEAVKEVNCNCAALDTEWKPDSFKLKGEPHTSAATLQVGVWKQDINPEGFRLTTGGPMKVFIVGLQELDEADFIRVVQPLFLNENILKLGFCFDEDKSRIKMRFPSFSNEIINMYDISKITDTQRSKGMFDNKKQIALNDLVVGYLDCVMEKRVRMSDWEMRPLTQRQIEYAANDAIVLLEVWREIVRAGDEQY